MNTSTAMPQSDFVKNGIQYALCWNDKHAHKRPGDYPKFQHPLGREMLRRQYREILLYLWDSFQRGDKRTCRIYISRAASILGNSVFASCGDLSACDTIRSVMNDLGVAEKSVSGRGSCLLDALKSNKPIAEIARCIKSMYDI